MAATQQERRRPILVEFYASAVGKKWTMAVTGVILLGFIFVHMLGNLHAFEGVRQLNEYAEGLRDIGEPLVPRALILWLIRLVLIAAAVLHIHAAYDLTIKNEEARSSKYAERHYLAVNYASRTMRWSGVIVLLFVIWHLADLTWGVEAVNPAFEQGEVYDNLVASLSRPAVAVLYFVAQAALALHIWHGAWSMFQSIGAAGPRFGAWRRRFASAFSALVVAGYVAVPVGVLTGVIS